VVVADNGVVIETDNLRMRVRVSKWSVVQFGVVCTILVAIVAALGAGGLRATQAAADKRATIAYFRSWSKILSPADSVTLNAEVARLKKEGADRKQLQAVTDSIFASAGVIDSIRLKEASAAGFDALYLGGLALILMGLGAVFLLITGFVTWTWVSIRRKAQRLAMGHALRRG
jgi:hypothetical protein